MTKLPEREDSEITQNGEEYTSEIEDINKEDETDSVSTENRSTSTYIKKLKKKDHSIATFDTLIETLYDAGLKAQRNVQVANIHNLENFFEDLDNDGILEPKMIKIKVPSNKKDTEDKWEVVEIPLFSLINHNTMKIDNLQVKFKINLEDMIKESFNKDCDKMLKTSCGKGLHKKKWKLKINRPTNKNVNCAEVCVDFKYDHPLESIVRLSERYSRLI